MILVQLPKYLCVEKQRSIYDKKKKIFLIIKNNTGYRMMPDAQILVERLGACCGGGAHRLLRRRWSTITGCTIRNGDGAGFKITRYDPTVY